MKKTLISLAACLLCAVGAFAQDGSWSVNAGTEAMSQFIWRGTEAALHPTIIPTISLDWENDDCSFELGQCSITELTGDEYLEMDIWASFSYKGLSFTFTEFGMGNNLGIGGYEDNAEVSLAYEFPWSVPVSLSWNTFVLGDDFNENGKRAFSSYAELAVPYEIGDLTLTGIVGAVPFRSDWTYGNETDSFKLTNVTLNATYNLSLDNLELPVYAQFIRNPMTKSNYYVLGCVLNLCFDL